MLTTPNDVPPAADFHIVCAACHATFQFTVGEQVWFAERGYGPPKRCRHCRERHKADLEAARLHASQTRDRRRST